MLATKGRTDNNAADMLGSVGKDNA
jgi:hypothetical protein